MVLDDSSALKASPLTLERNSRNRSASKQKSNVLSSFSAYNELV